MATLFENNQVQGQKPQEYHIKYTQRLIELMWHTDRFSDNQPMGLLHSLLLTLSSLYWSSLYCTSSAMARSPFCLRVPSHIRGCCASEMLAFKPKAVTAASKPSCSSLGSRVAFICTQRLGGRLPVPEVEAALEPPAAPPLEF